MDCNPANPLTTNLDPFYNYKYEKYICIPLLVQGIYLLTLIYALLIFLANHILGLIYKLVSFNKVSVFYRVLIFSTQVRMH